MTEFQIRPGGEDDVPAVLALLDGAVAWLAAHGRPGQWGVDPMSANPRRVAMTWEMARDGKLHVATVGDAVAGALAVGEAPGYVPSAVGPELYVELLVTDRGQAGRGIGGGLLDHARRLARAANLDPVRVDCYAGDDRALVRYYERQGFIATDRFEVALSTGQKWPGQVLEQRLRSTDDGDDQ